MTQTAPALPPRPRLLVLNPNRTAAMTDAVLHELRRLTVGQVELRGFTCDDGPPVIATRESFAAGAAAAARAWPAVDDGWADAVLLSCYGDPGLAALRAASRVPVLGMAESSMLQALARGRPFHIVTAGKAWGPMLHELAARHSSAWPLLHGITTLDTTGLAGSQNPAAFSALVQRALDDLAGAHPGGMAPDCMLGGAGFAGMRPTLRYGGLLEDGLQAALAQWRPLPVTPAS
ncbi:aspartate/glutamate racemase family protein [uncultured Pseudacidovorax sp.]|uniref:aspartate/glutamate racemase family protein n=1 Tax=uncultured Pseudacidovorax sp. TaxID=679313 RepID=UPI0025F0F5C2|nr:aspartate/glutamate racemase family protein [uncultured Pseudacidovorax sp.]